jgi:hypothetical protein
MRRVYVLYPDGISRTGTIIARVACCDPVMYCFQIGVMHGLPDQCGVSVSISGKGITVIRLGRE